MEQREISIFPIFEQKRQIMSNIRFLYKNCGLLLQNSLLAPNRLNFWTRRFDFNFPESGQNAPRFFAKTLDWSPKIICHTKNG
jgi:hypothetical protein